MRIHPLALSVALLCGGVVLSGCNDNNSSASNDNNVKPEVKAPWDFDLYLVGEFSGWDRTDKFKLVFKDGVAFDPTKLLESVKGRYGQY